MSGAQSPRVAYVTLSNRRPGTGISMCCAIPRLSKRSLVHVGTYSVTIGNLASTNFRFAHRRNFPHSKNESAEFLSAKLVSGTLACPGSNLRTGLSRDFIMGVATGVLSRTGGHAQGPAKKERDMGPTKGTCSKHRDEYEGVDAVIVDTRPNLRGNVIAVHRHGTWKWPRLEHGTSALSPLVLPRVRRSPRAKP
jgi:hypothetical protein